MNILEITENYINFKLSDVEFIDLLIQNINELIIFAYTHYSLINKKIEFKISLLRQKLYKYTTNKLLRVNFQIIDSKYIFSDVIEEVNNITGGLSEFEINELLVLNCNRHNHIYNINADIKLIQNINMSKLVQNKINIHTHLENIKKYILENNKYPFPNALPN